MNQPPRPPNGKSSAHYGRPMQLSPHSHAGRSNPSRWPTHGSLSKEFRQVYNTNEKESNFDGCAKSVMPNATMNSSSLFVADSTNEMRELRQISPPLSYNGADNPLSLRAPSLTNLANHSMEMNHCVNRPIDYPLRNTATIMNFGPRPLSELRMSPIHIQNSPTFFHNSQQDDRPKSESPSRKRRRVSLSHHMVESTPSVPHPSNSRWDTRRPQRQNLAHNHNHNHHIHYNNHSQRRNSRKMRNNSNNNSGYNGHLWTEIPREPYTCSPPPHHGGPYQLHHSSPTSSPSQSQALMVDVTQVPISVPVSIYTGSPIAVCQGGGGGVGSTHASSLVHNIYTNPSPQQIHHCSMGASQYTGNCIQNHQQSQNHHLHHHHHTGHHSPPVGGGISGYLSPRSQSSLLYSSPTRPDTMIHMPPSPPIFISENPFPNRATSMDLSPRSRSTMVSNLIMPSARRWRYHPFPGASQYSNTIVQLLAMITTPLSPELANSDSEMENYEALLHVAERLSEDRPRGLNRVEINQIRSFKFDIGKHQRDQTTCVVCMCDFEDQQLLRDLRCSHMFHARCVDKWLKTNRTCPICRGDASGDPSLSE